MFTGEIDLDDTDEKDKPILSAASLAGTPFVVTENVKDFGTRDPARLKMSAVHPDLFLANRLSAVTYSDVLGRLSRASRREPNTAAEEIHRVETDERLPLLARRMVDTFAVEYVSPTKGVPRLRFRGVGCVSCGQFIGESLHALGQALDVVVEQHFSHVYQSLLPNDRIISIVPLELNVR